MRVREEKLTERDVETAAKKQLFLAEARSARVNGLSDGQAASLMATRLCGLSLFEDIREYGASRSWSTGIQGRAWRGEAHRKPTQVGFLPKVLDGKASGPLVNSHR